MSQLFRETAAGQLVRLITNNKYLQYPEEKDDFECPTSYTKSVSSSSSISDLADEKEVELPVEPIPSHIFRTYTYETHVDPSTLEKAPTQPVVPQKTEEGITLVDWYNTDDEENPQNWSSGKKAFVAFVIIIYTAAVYMGSAIYSPSIPGVMEVFGVSLTKASLGLSMYVLGYGLGPLIFAPMSELPMFGRNVPYLGTFGIFLLISIPTALVNNFPALIVLRFLQGFFGSPALANGGASMQDLYPFIKLPYLLSLWVAGASVGPSMGPLISGFSVPAKNWHWSMLELLWYTAPVFVLMIVGLPETSTPNILLRRARRLRALTGKTAVMSQSEIDVQHLTIRDIAIDALWRPIQITILDPAVLFANLYTSLVYGIFYSFFEVFPLVYPVYYGFNGGETGLVFLSTSVSVAIGLAIYWSYWRFYMTPRLLSPQGAGPAEVFLRPALFAAFLLPIGLFIFGWTANKNIHWIVSIIGLTIYTCGVFIILQCIFLYLPVSYPQYAASIFAGNDLWRSALASGAILFSHPMFVNLGVGGGVSLLAGLTVACIVGVFVLYNFGAPLRARSKFASKD